VLKTTSISCRKPLIVLSGLNQWANGDTGRLESLPHNRLESLPHNRLESLPHNRLESLPHNRLESLPHNRLESLPHNRLESLPHGRQTLMGYWPYFLAASIMAM